MTMRILVTDFYSQYLFFMLHELSFPFTVTAGSVDTACKKGSVILV